MSFVTDNLATFLILAVVIHYCVLFRVAIYIQYVQISFVMFTCLYVIFYTCSIDVNSLTKLDQSNAYYLLILLLWTTSVV
jgi:hypothetical protein